MSKVISFAGLVAAFALAYGCDRWVEALRENVIQPSSTASFLWQAGVANLLLAIALLALTWYANFEAKRSKLISSVFLLIGLIVTFAVAIEASVSSTLPPLGIVEFLTPNSHVLYAAAFVAVIGIAGFVLPKQINHERAVMVTIDV
jgi:ABC-type transport system involved in cytochrome c biogenesis permease subunit